MRQLPPTTPPPALRPDALERCVWSRTEADDEGLVVTLLDVQEEEDGALVVRQVWWYDPERGQWDLDERSEWVLPVDAAHALAAALRPAT